ncbi:MerR family transcriptional regulator [Amycolatopsis acidiphila]|uniref:MerR family transcriptional regulator n=1 Tax=Amycolatopsis acidiphila TaxID=715473 RepID=A0A557ZR66_9PSEU|nr:MerR family transcriptional regulator [Amycolatopsis acidiphila]TVT14458.1 MerR family transcriptional regulator [Amycolatopsis acidiphila]UIJ60756.1 MerR family transcriptional regulator [Amycolatopsis acidiphila]
MDRAREAEPTMPVAAVARRLGVAPATLRTWDRRYGLGPSRHTGGKHRRYGAADIRRLELMQRALLRGASTAEAARFALAAPVTDAPAETAQPVRAEPDRSVARRLRGAALAMDAAATQRLLAEAIADAGVLAAWENVIEPVLTAFGAGWHGAHSGVEAEYLLTECVLGALIRATPLLDEPRNSRPVLLSGVPDERVNLPLYALAACLAERGIAAQLFGTPPPAEVLAVAVRRSAPAAVVLRAQRSTVADGRLFPRVSRGRQRSRVFAWGPGWVHTPLPEKVELLPGLRTAVDRIEYVLLGR